MAGIGDNSGDKNPISAPQDKLGVQAHHIIAEELFKNADIRDLLLKAGITVNSRANYTIVPTESNYAAFLQSLSADQKRQLVDSGFSTNYQFGSHPNYTAVEETLLFNIILLYPNLDDPVQARHAIVESRTVLDFMTKLSGGLIKDASGNVLTIMGTDKTAAFSAYADFNNSEALRFVSLAERAQAQAIKYTPDFVLDLTNPDPNPITKNAIARQVILDSAKPVFESIVNFDTDQSKVIIDHITKASGGENPGFTSAGWAAMLVSFKKNMGTGGPVTEAEMLEVMAGNRMLDAANNGMSLTYRQAYDDTSKIIDLAKSEYSVLPDTVAELGPHTRGYLLRSTDSIFKSFKDVGGGKVAGAAVFIDATYEGLKKGIATGNWSDFVGQSIKFGATVAVFMAAETVSTAAATAANPLLGAVVAAGWTIFNYAATGLATVDLVSKIADDVNKFSPTIAPFLKALSDKGVTENDIDFILNSYEADILRRVATNNPPEVGVALQLPIVVDDLDPRFPTFGDGSILGDKFIVRNGAEVDGWLGNDEIYSTGWGKIKGGSGDDKIILFNNDGATVDAGSGDDLIFAEGTHVGANFHSITNDQEVNISADDGQDTIFALNTVGIPVTGIPVTVHVLAERITA